MFWKMFWPTFAVITALVFGAPFANAADKVDCSGMDAADLVDQGFDLARCKKPKHAPATLPKEMFGSWCQVKKDGDVSPDDEYERCNVKESDNATMVVNKHNVLMYGEDGCDFTKVEKIDQGVFYVHGDCGGEGMSWKSTLIFQHLPNGHLQIAFIRHWNEKHEG